MIEPRTRILVIDDDDAVRTLICTNLEDCNYKVEGAANGEEGLARLKAGPVPDLVITDMIMPKIDGLSAIREIRALYPDIKMIAISGGGTKARDILGEARAMGADAVLYKPLNLSELESMILDLIPRAKQNSLPEADFLEAKKSRASL